MLPVTPKQIVPVTDFTELFCMQNLALSKHTEHPI